MKITFRIYKCTFGIEGVEKADVPLNMLKFLSDEGPCDFVYSFGFVDALPEPSDGWQTIYQSYNIHIWRKGDLERRRISVSSSQDAYAVYEETEAGNVKVFFRSQLRKDLRIDTVFMSCLALERRFARRGCYILHCAYLCYKGQGILFSGPSGIGKSTHANIWCKTIDDTHVVNGDRALLVQNADGVYEAYGWPVCGSSNICHNEHYPLKAIVFVEQRLVNSVLQESLMSHYRRLAAQITINHWDKNVTSSSLDWLLALSQHVSLCTYGCNMDKEAPRNLKMWLELQGVIHS